MKRLVIAAILLAVLASAVLPARPGAEANPDATFTQVSAGVLHSCGVKTGGTLACWGFNEDGRATPPAGSFTQVSAGGMHTCGVKTDGTLACWGNNEYGQATPPKLTPTPTPTPSPTPTAVPTPTAARTLQWNPGWQNATWSGSDDTAPQDAFACAVGSYAAAYRFVDGGLERYFPDRPDISNMGPLNKHDAFLILITRPATCTMPVALDSGATRTLQWDPGWHNDGWSGASGTASQSAFACADGNYAAAYRFVDGGLERYFPDRPDISNMGPLNKHDAFLILITRPVTCAMPIVP